MFKTLPCRLGLHLDVTTGGGAHFGDDLLTCNVCGRNKYPETFWSVAKAVVPVVWWSVLIVALVLAQWPTALTGDLILADWTIVFKVPNFYGLSLLGTWFTLTVWSCN